jgi:DNA gyrase inhibitor GyrI
VPLDRLAQALAADGGQVTLTELPAGLAVRVRRRTEATTQDIHVTVPESGAYLILSFSTPLDQLADAMVDLFDSIAGTLRWIP